MSASTQVNWVLDEAQVLLDEMQLDGIRISFDAGTVKCKFGLDREEIQKVLKPGSKVTGAKDFIKLYKDHSPETRASEKTNFYTAQRIDPQKWDWKEMGANWQTQIDVDEVWERACEVVQEFTDNPVYIRYVRYDHGRNNAYGSCKHTIVGLAISFLISQRPREYEFLSPVVAAFKTNFILNGGEASEVPAYKIFKYHLSSDEKDEINTRGTTDQSIRYIKPVELATLVLPLPTRTTINLTDISLVDNNDH